MDEETPLGKTSKTGWSTTRRIVAVCATLVALAVIVGFIVLGMNDKEVPEAFFVLGGAALGVLGTVLAGIQDSV